MENYPSNSNKKRPIKIANARVRSKPILYKIFGDNINGVGEYVFWDVLLPAIKDTITDIISNATEMIFYGERRGRGSSNIRRDRNTSYVSYSGYYKNREEKNRERRNSHDRNRHNFDDVVLNRREEAEEVLSSLADLILDYGVATVADFYEMVGMQSSWADHKYGWEDVRNASVRRVRDGYVLILPPTIALD